MFSTKPLVKQGAPTSAPASLPQLKGPGTGTATRKRLVRTKHAARQPAGAKGAAEAASGPADFHGAVDARITGLREDVEDYRRELDILRQERLAAERNLEVATDEYNELCKMHFATSDLEETRDKMIEV